MGRVIVGPVDAWLTRMIDAKQVYVHAANNRLVGRVAACKNIDGWMYFASEPMTAPMSLELDHATAYLADQTGGHMTEPIDIGALKVTRGQAVIVSVGVCWDVDPDSASPDPVALVRSPEGSGGNGP